MSETTQQQNLFDADAPGGPVECLGMTFESDAARRSHFLEILREKLKDPEFRQIEGFPIGEDEDILALSDPPYYTACPNPFLEQFIECYGKPYDPETDDYHREPFATDVSEGKNDPIYNAHSYHTKVPHKAIMRYILHYTEPGEIVFDGFCGTGMTGVAAQLCGDTESIQALGYSLDKDNSIFDEKGDYVSKLGSRRSILGDLSTVATFIAYSYNTRTNIDEFEQQARALLSSVKEDCEWMYLTLHQPKEKQLKKACETLIVEAKKATQDDNDLPFGKINYTIYSDVFSCPECASEVVFWQTAIDHDKGCVKDRFPCPECASELTKGVMERAWSIKLDDTIGQTIRQAKQVPVLINYTFGNKKFEKVPDSFDLLLIEYIEGKRTLDKYPISRMPEGEESRRNDDIGITHVHHYYTRRNLLTLASFSEKVFTRQNNLKELLILTGAMPDLEKTARLRIGAYFKGGRGVVSAGLSGTLYIPSLSIEKRVTFGLENRIKTLKSVLPKCKAAYSSVITTQSSTKFKGLAESVDYIFLDPPFGSNLVSVTGVENRSCCGRE